MKYSLKEITNSHHDCDDKKKLDIISPDATGEWVDLYRKAVDCISSCKSEGEEKLLEIVLKPITVKEETDSDNNETDPVLVKEAAIYELIKIQEKSASADSYKKLIHAIRPIFFSIPKTRTAKIIRNFLDLLSSIPNAAEVQKVICKDTIAWCIQEKRTFLRHRVETRLAFVYLQLRQYTAGLELVKHTLKEVKKLDDKLLMVELHYAETRLYFELNNLAKAKTALTAARSNINAIHCPPILQADIDIMSGALHLEDADSKTAFSYFIEAYEAYNNIQHPKAIDALRYAMLSKIMTEQPKDVISMATNRQCNDEINLQYGGPSIDVLKTIAQSYLKKDLKIFEKCLEENKENVIFSRHINKLYQSLLEKNILRILNLYSRVEVAHVAKLLDLSYVTTQEKLSQMILDKQLDGTLHQESGILKLHEPNEMSSLYGDTLAVIANLSSVVDILASKAQSTMQTEVISNHSTIPPNWVQNNVKYRINSLESPPNIKTSEKMKLINPDQPFGDEIKKELSTQDSEYTEDSLYKERYGSTNIPLHFAVSHSQFFSFPLSPFSMYYYDETAPNKFLLLNDLGEDTQLFKIFWGKITSRDDLLEDKPETLYTDTISLKNLNLDLEKNISSLVESEVIDSSRSSEQNVAACCQCIQVVSKTTTEATSRIVSETDRTQVTQEYHMSSNCANTILRNLKPMTFTPFTQQSTCPLTPSTQCLYCRGTKYYNCIKTNSDGEYLVKRPCTFCPNSVTQSSAVAQQNSHIKDTLESSTKPSYIIDYSKQKIVDKPTFSPYSDMYTDSNKSQTAAEINYTLNNTEPEAFVTNSPPNLLQNVQYKPQYSYLNYNQYYSDQDNTQKLKGLTTEEKYSMLSSSNKDSPLLINKSQSAEAATPQIITNKQSILSVSSGSAVVESDVSMAACCCRPKQPSSVEILPDTYITSTKLTSKLSSSKNTCTNTCSEALELDSQNEILYQKHKLFFSTNHSQRYENMKKYEYSYSVSYKHYPVIFYDALTQLPSTALIQS